MVTIEIITWLLIYQSLILIFTFLFLLDNAKTLLLCYAQLCLTLSNAMDYSQLGSSVHGIFQARILKWVAIPFSRGSSWPRDGTYRRILYHCANWEQLNPLNFLQLMCYCVINFFLVKKIKFTIWDFPGSPVAKSPSFHWKEHGFHPGWETKIPEAAQGSQKTNKKALCIGKCLWIEEVLVHLCSDHTIP